MPVYETAGTLTPASKPSGKRAAELAAELARKSATDNLSLRSSCDVLRLKKLN